MDTPELDRLAEHAAFAGRSIVLRPLSEDDEPALREFLVSLAGEDIRSRFFGATHSPEQAYAGKYADIDPEHELVVVAMDDRRMLGMGHLAWDADRVAAEFALIVRSDIKGRGLGRMLLDKLLRHARQLGLARVTGQILQDNQRMLSLARELGFSLRDSGEPGIQEVVIEFEGPPHEAGELR